MLDEMLERYEVLVVVITFITHSLSHSSLKTYLFHKSFPFQPTCQTNFMMFSMLNGWTLVLTNGALSIREVTRCFSILQLSSNPAVKKCF